MRILDDRERRRNDAGTKLAVRQVAGGLLVQDPDAGPEDREHMQVVSSRSPSDSEWAALLFASTVCKYVRSNAIVLSRDTATVGIGAGQMSRVDSVRLAIEKSNSPLDGVAMASDAFFPFADGPEQALEHGIAAIIQPGGSVRDAEVIEAVDRAGATMVFTKRRHFRH
jgi:phosphoribosylaminoimidazolecarboxamide formyltransferase/IMP cyclohydrolase